jgi:magnesium transporter
MEMTGEVLENLSALVESGQRGMVMNVVADLYPADLALLLEHLSADEAGILFHWLPTERAGEVLPELDDDFRAALLEEVHSERITEIIDELDTDDAADVLADLPHDVVREVLPALEDKVELEELLSYDEESAGGIMGTEFVAVPGDWTVSDATEEVRRKADDVEPIYAVFVLDSERRLIGGVSLKRLLLSRAGSRMDTVMDTDDICVVAGVDQEEVARVMERYDMVSLPVVDNQRRPIGRITIDDVVDVLRDEAEEDIQRMSGVAGGEEPTDSILRITRGRLPWLMAGLCGAGLSSFVIAGFEHSLEQAVVLAFFIPIVMATAGNAGIQSSAIAVQGIAAGDVWSGDLLKRLAKEMGVAVINALALAAVLAVGVLFLVDADRPRMLALTASLALVLVIILATTIGAAVPLVLNRLGIDPALATGPFITTTNDILGILVFFILASLIYLT